MSGYVLFVSICEIFPELRIFVRLRDPPGFLVVCPPHWFQSSKPQLPSDFVESFIYSVVLCSTTTVTLHQPAYSPTLPVQEDKDLTRQFT